MSRSKVKKYTRKIFHQKWYSWDKSEYYKTIGVKVQEAIDGSVEEDFLAHRASLLTDPWMKSQALKLAEDISNADGELHDYEASLLRQVAGLLYVTDQESGTARKRARERLGI